MRRQTLLLAAINGIVGASFGLANWGTAASVMLLRDIAPLPVWGTAHSVVAVLLIVRQEVPAHLLAALLWAMWAIGAVLGLLSYATTSQGGSIALAGMVVVLAGQHLNAMAWRRDVHREARSRREQ